MKKFRYISIIFLTFALYHPAFNQTSGALWIKTFQPGSNNLTDPQIDKFALTTLDSLMQDETIEATFLGAADSLKWNMNGKRLHKNISDALNDAKRLGRARALRQRYGRGNVGITHENIAGVKVIWTKNSDYTTNLEQIREQTKNLEQELAEMKSNLQSLQPEKSTDGENGHSNNIIKERLTFNWSLQAGLWTWQSGSNGSIFAPSLALNIIIGKTAFVIQGGVTPWHISSPYGNQSESFVYVGLKYMKSDILGFSAGGFRGWEFFTSTDDWSLKTTGIGAGIILTHGRIELNPMLTLSNIDTLDKTAVWKIGSMLGVNININ